ncbi:MAG: DUF3347 domain-containing protein, partial [Gillisia sp.]
MKNFKIAMTLTLVITMVPFLGSCKNETKNENRTVNKLAKKEKKLLSEAETSNSVILINDYLDLKNALVADNSLEATKSAKKILDALAHFDPSGYPEKQIELKHILGDLKVYSEEIAMSEGKLQHQREQFEMLSKNMLALIKITGSDKTLYQDFCPMFNNGKGAVWLSEMKEIKNPYYGRKMPGCGR